MSNNATSLKASEFNLVLSFNIKHKTCLHIQNTVQSHTNFWIMPIHWNCTIFLLNKSKLILCRNKLKIEALVLYKHIYNFIYFFLVKMNAEYIQEYMTSSSNLFKISSSQDYWGHSGYV